MIVDLTEESILEATKFAKELNDYKEQHNISNNIWAKKYNNETCHIAGELYEAAFRQVFESSWNKIIHKSGDPGYDTEMEGFTIQIKGTEHENWTFIFDSEDPNDFKADLGVIVFKDSSKENRFQIYGYFTKEEFLQNYYTIKFRSTGNVKPAFPREKLHLIKSKDSFLEELKHLKKTVKEKLSLKYDD